METIRRVIATGKTAAVDYSMLLSGNRRHFSGILTYIPGSEGGVGTVGCIMRDMTESRLIESHVRENEARWRALYEHAGVGIAQLTLDGQFLRVNPHVCEILGYSSEVMLERNLQDLTHPDDIQANLAYLAELLEGKRHSFSMEKRYRRVDHTWVWVDDRISRAHRLQRSGLFDCGHSEHRRSEALPFASASSHEFRRRRPSHRRSTGEGDKRQSTFLVTLEHP